MPASYLNSPQVVAIAITLGWPTSQPLKRHVASGDGLNVRNAVGRDNRCRRHHGRVLDQGALPYRLD